MMTEAMPPTVCPNGHGALAVSGAGSARAAARASSPPRGPLRVSKSGTSDPHRRDAENAVATRRGEANAALPPSSLSACSASLRCVSNPQVVCGTCGGGGARLPVIVTVCPECRWLRPLAPGYAVEPSAFQWAQDGAAMAKLRSFAPLNAAAHGISKTGLAAAGWRARSVASGWAITSFPRSGHRRCTRRGSSGCPICRTSTSPATGCGSR